MATNLCWFHQEAEMIPTSDPHACDICIGIKEWFKTLPVIRFDDEEKMPKVKCDKCGDAVDNYALTADQWWQTHHYHGKCQEEKDMAEDDRTEEEIAAGRCECQQWHGDIHLLTHHPDCDGTGSQKLGPLAYITTPLIDDAPPVYSNDQVHPSKEVLEKMAKLQEHMRAASIGSFGEPKPEQSTVKDDNKAYFDAFQSQWDMSKDFKSGISNLTAAGANVGDGQRVVNGNDFECFICGKLIERRSDIVAVHQDEYAHIQCLKPEQPTVSLIVVDFVCGTVVSIVDCHFPLLQNALKDLPVKWPRIVHDPFVIESPFATVKTAIDAQISDKKPVPRLELKGNDWYTYHGESSNGIPLTCEIQNWLYDDLCKIAGHPLPIYSSHDRWEKLSEGLWGAVWRFTSHG